MPNKMKTIIELEKEIEDMEKLAEKFVDNKFVKIGKRKTLGLDAVNDCYNFLREYEYREATLTQTEAIAEIIQQRISICENSLDATRDEKWIHIGAVLKGLLNEIKGESKCPTQ